MASKDKGAVVDELSKLFQESTAAVLTEYRGLSVAQMQTLRRSLGTDTTYTVVKNTLTKRAAERAGVTGIDDLLVGPTAIAFVSGDPVDAAKGLRDFGKENQALVIKAGLVDGALMSASDISKLADLESREVLLAKLAGAMKASMGQAAALFQAPLSQAARTVEALRVKAEADPSVIGGAGEAPAATEAATETSDAEPAAADETSSDASPETTEG